MKYLSKYLVMGLILLSSIHALAQVDAGTAAAATVEPPGSPPAGPTGYPPEDVIKPATHLQSVQGPSLEAADVAEHVKKETADLKKSIDEYTKNQQNCKAREDKANTFCMESRNPDAKNYIMISQVLMAGVSGMADACEKFGKVMAAGSKMLTSYQAACSTFRGYCISACGAAKRDVLAAQKNLEALIAKATSYADTQKGEALKANPPRTAQAENYVQIKMSYEKQAPQLKEALSKELTPTDSHLSIADKVATCDGYAKELVTAGLGLLGMAKSFGQANKCDKNTSNAALAGATPVDCNLPANKQNNMTCICEAAPRTPGCTKGLDSVATAKNADSLRAASPSGYTPAMAAGKNSGIDGGAAGSSDFVSKGDSSDGGGLPGAPTGGSAGIDGGNGGSTGPGGSQGAGKTSGLNTKILSGEGGGGGGGGGAYGSGSEGGNKGLRQYLPGGIKDPTALAGQGAVSSKEVTSPGGKSNWEKVRERYRDNKPSLLGY